MASDTRSASLNEAERKIKSLESDNLRLKEELASVTTLYNQLVNEGKQEKYDERRVTFLKSQLIQLERQLVIYSEALSSRSQALMEVDNGLMSTADGLRFRVNESCVGAKGQQVALSKSEIEEVIGSLESCRIKLYKNVENNTSEKLAKPVTMIDRFIKSDNSKPVTLLDVCSGKTDHLNLKHVAKLESKLSVLYRQLFVMSKSLHSILTENESANIAHINSGIYKSLGGQVAHACKLLEEVNVDLLTLSVLVPSAPWPVLSRPHIKDLSSERVLATLPNFQKNKASEGKVMIEALMKAVNCSLQIKSLEADVLKQEIHMHQAIYKAQMDYTESLISSLMKGYASFERETYELLCMPLKTILDNYGLLSSNADGESLRKFLESFKDQSAQIGTAIDLFTPNDSNKDAFSAYGKAFHESLQKIQVNCQKERDEKVSNLDEVKDYLQKSLDELKMMCPALPQKSKNDAQTPTQTKADGFATPGSVRTKKSTNLEENFGGLNLKSPDLGSQKKHRAKRTTNIDKDAGDVKQKSKKSGAQTESTDSVSCTCGVEQDCADHRRGSLGLASTPTSSAASRVLPTLKRPTSLPRLNSFSRRGSQESGSGSNSPLLSRESTPRMRNTSSIPSPSSGAYSSPKGVNMKKLTLIPKMPKDKDNFEQ